jgi:putative ATP-dependent endonuclease of OLD family
MPSSVIERIIIEGYRRFERIELEPNQGINIIVGDNEAGKSTLIEAVHLALTGKINGRWAVEELNPYWFHRPQVQAFFERYGTSSPLPPPELRIEIYLSNEDDVQKLRGVHNSRRQDCPGVSMRISAADEYDGEFAEYMATEPPAVLPVEFYEVEWRDFSDRHLAVRPKELGIAFIDSRTIRSTSGVDYHTRELISGHLDDRERALISVAHRKSKQSITDGQLADINDRIAENNKSLHDRPIGLQMDQSARTSWEVGVVPQVDEIPFGMSGQGQQAAIKVSLAMSRSAGKARYVLIEEPENHLSHTSLTRLVARIEVLASDEQQVFITTHSSYVLNRLGLDRLVLLHAGRATKLTQLGPDTVDYFKKLSGYDTLRLVLAKKVALVEGPSDDIILQRAFVDATGLDPAAAGIDIISMGGLTFKRAFEVCTCLDRQAIGLTDNDAQSVATVIATVSHLTKPGRRELLVSDSANGPTLEPQLRAVNDETTLRRILGVTPQADLATWMKNNKTEGALRILEAAEPIVYPEYINRAIELLR